MTSDGTLLTVKDVSAAYGKVVALRGVSLSVNRG
jgi:branched-chain amino acid transport system ATP-binding protein